MSKKWELKSIKDFIKKESNCILLSEEYKDNKQRLEFQCECGEIFKKSWKEFVYENKRKCPKCFRKAMGMRSKFKYAEVLQQLKDLGYILLSKNYEAVDQKIDVKDFEGYKYYVTLHNLKANKSTQKFEKRNPYTVHNINLWLKLNNNNFVLLPEEYINATAKMEWQCSLCDKIYFINWATMQSGYKCSCKTNRGLIYTHEQFINMVKSHNPHITILEKYAGSQNRIKCRCEKDGHEWSPIAQHLIRGSGCPKCVGRYKTHEEFISMLDLDFLDIEIIGKYKNTKTKILCKCKHNHEWMAYPDSLIRSMGCPKCKSSKGERKIFLYLQKLNISYNFQFSFDDCKYIERLPFDFYLPNYNMCIEYDGEAHYFPVKFAGMSQEKAEKQFELQQLRDQIKNEYCENNNIKLLRIPYWEFKNIKEILNKELESKLIEGDKIEIAS